MLVSAQDKPFVKGEKLYNQFRYSEAIPYLEKSYKQNSNPDALVLLAYSYLKVRDYTNAISYFRVLAFDRKANPEYYLEYGKLLKNQGLYREAKPWFIQYLRRNPSNMEVRELLRSCDMTPEWLNNPEGYGVEPWQYNTAYMEFCPVHYQDQLVFTSNRIRDVDGGKYGWDNLPYLKLMSVADSGGNPAPFVLRNSARFHVGPAVFEQSGRRMYFTRNHVENGRAITDENGVTRLMILYIDKVDGKWTKPVQVNFNSKEYSVGHPCLSRDGNTLYFASDMPGGQGGTDIWMARKIGEHEWAEPENLGPKVNSPGNELFPSLFGDTLLSFSSDYHPGLGGLDIFISQYMRGSWSAPQNLGYPVNSFQDDFGFVFNADGNSGFLASNRKGGKGFDDIYTFRKIKVCVSITVMDSNTYNLIPKAVVRITNGYQFTEELMTGADGKVHLCVPIDNRFRITAERKGYAPKRFAFSSVGLYEDKDTMLLAELVPGKWVNFSGVVINDANDSLIDGALIKIHGSDGFSEITSSNALGYFDLAIDAGETYELEATKEGFLLHKEKFVMPDSQVVKEVRLRTSEINQKIKLRNIYYDLNSSVIREDAAVVLDTLVKIMLDNPYLQIEIGSHTDSRASGEYNRQLSLERAKAVIEYLRSKGIDPYRISYTYYGETQLIAPCPDGVDCPEEQHQLNRRTEFKILAN